MEWKGNRSVQPKVVATETKKNQDVANKLWPRGGRRREPHGGTISKNDASRKPTPQRNKTVDKRPRARGCYYTGGTVDGTENAGISAQDAEIGSVFNQGSKKQNYSHLLNFRFDGLESSRQYNANPSKFGHRWNMNGKHKYNKENFLQANCQFVVRECGDYKMYMSNPDALVDWNFIEQVNIHVSEFPCCPICLYPPAAAKMTRCGHIYCWSCMLYYLTLSENTWRTCPICYETVRKNDLKSVIAVPHSTFLSGETITFKLMKRIKGSLITYPADYEIQDVDVPFSVSDDNATNVYSKLLLAAKSDVMAIIARERKELEQQLSEDENCREKTSIEQALELLVQREEFLFTNLHVDGNETKNLVPPEVLEEWKKVSIGENSDENCSSNDSTVGIAQAVDIPTTPSSDMPKCFYFYQASDGQHIYLNPLNARMLEYTYGSLEYCPKTVQGRILEKEPGSVTEEFRKRFRYLQHLPVTCQFEIAEISIYPPIITRDTAEYFREQVESRRKHRQRKARDEKRREKRITEEENKKMGKYAAANIRLESHQQFPEFNPSAEDFVGPALPQIENSFSEFTINDQSDTASVLGSSPETGVSFAKMLSSKNAPPVWPVRTSSVRLPEMKESSSKLREDSDAVLAAPTSSFGDFISLAFQNADGGKKKKKRKKGKTTMSSDNDDY